MTLDDNYRARVIIINWNEFYFPMRVYFSKRQLIPPLLYMFLIVRDEERSLPSDSSLVISGICPSYRRDVRQA